MTLEELLQAMKDAEAKATAAPTDKALQAEFAQAKKAYEDAKAAADDDQDPPGGEGGDDPDEFDESKTDEKTKKYLKKLREENAKHRTKAKDLGSKLKSEEERRKAILKAAGIEDDSEEPEEKIKSLTAQNETQAFRTAILESAIEHGIPKEGLKYYQFLMSEAVSSLEEGEELSDEKMTEVVAEAKKFGGKKAANSSVGTGGKEGAGGTSTAPPPGGKGGTITVERFCAMSMVEKSKLYTDNRDLYEALVAEAKRKKKLV